MMHSTGLWTPPDGQCWGKCRVLQSFYTDIMSVVMLQGVRDVFIHLYELNNVNHKQLKPFIKSCCIYYISVEKMELKNVKMQLRIHLH